MASDSSFNSRRNVRFRTAKAFAVFIVTLSLVIGIWTWARHQMPEEGIPAPFRTVLEWNGILWRNFFSVRRMNRSGPPPVGQAPRFNGDIGLESPLEAARWTLEVVSDGQDHGAPKYRMTLGELRSFPRTETAAEFYCIEGWSDRISYAGIRFSDFLRFLKITPRRYVGLETPDGEYYVSVDMESMLHPQTVLAYEMNGRPLDAANGAPLRLIIPVKYGIKSLKRIGRIFLSDRRPPDYWGERGYDWFAGL